MSKDEKILTGLFWGACFVMGCFIGSTIHYKKLAEKNGKAFDIAMNWLMTEHQEENKETEA